MKNLKKIILSALAVTTLSAFSLFAVSCEDKPDDPSTPPACTEHVDANKNGECDNCAAEMEIPCDEHYDNDEDNICDNCEATIKEPVEYSVKIVDASGAPVEGVKIILLRQYKNGDTEKAVEATSDENGVISGTIIPGEFIIEASELPRGWYLDGNYTSFDINSENLNISFTAIDNNPAGTIDEPFFLGDEAFVEPFEAEETLYFFVKGSVYVEITTPGASLTYNSITYTAENGKISVLLDAPESANDITIFSVTNTTAEVNEITLVPVAIPGTSGNPFDFTPGTDVEVTVERDGTVYYEWTASANGTLTLTSTTPKNAIFMTNLKNSQTTNSTSSEVDTIEITLEEGDTVRVAVSYSFDTDNPSTDEDDTATLVFTSTFTAA